MLHLGYPQESIPGVGIPCIPGMDAPLFSPRQVYSPPSSNTPYCLPTTNGYLKGVCTSPLPERPSESHWSREGLTPSPHQSPVPFTMEDRVTLRLLYFQMKAMQAQMEALLATVSASGSPFASSISLEFAGNSLQNTGFFSPNVKRELSTVREEGPRFAAAPNPMSGNDALKQEYREDVPGREPKCEADVPLTEGQDIREEDESPQQKGPHLSPLLNSTSEVLEPQRSSASTPKRPTTATPAECEPHVVQGSASVRSRSHTTTPFSSARPSSRSSSVVVGAEGIEFEGAQNPLLGSSRSSSYRSSITGMQYTPGSIACPKLASLQASSGEEALQGMKPQDMRTSRISSEASLQNQPTPRQGIIPLCIPKNRTMGQKNLHSSGKMEPPLLQHPLGIRRYSSATEKNSTEVLCNDEQKKCDSQKGEDRAVEQPAATPRRSPIEKGLKSDSHFENLRQLNAQLLDQHAPIQTDSIAQDLSTTEIDTNDVSFETHEYLRSNGLWR